MNRPTLENIGLHLLALVLATVLYCALKNDIAPGTGENGRTLFNYR